MDPYLTPNELADAAYFQYLHDLYSVAVALGPRALIDLLVITVLLAMLFVPIVAGFLRNRKRDREREREKAHTLERLRARDLEIERRAKEERERRAFAASARYYDSEGNEYLFPGTDAPPKNDNGGGSAV